MAEANSIRVPSGWGQIVEANLRRPVIVGPHGNGFDSSVRPARQPHSQRSAALPSRPQDRRPRRSVPHDDTMTYRGAIVAVRSRRRGTGSGQSRGHQC
jgi:hypothetical protein